MKKINFSILCAGNIAETMAKTVSQMEEVTCYAIAARDLERARKLADKYGFQKAYGSYEELAKDENAGLIYIASPHSHHFEHAKLCLENGKNVLCEKAFTANARQAEELFRVAEEKKLFITEAVWTRFQPFVPKIREILESGVIGTPLTMTATFAQDLTHVQRLVSPELAGGVLLDLGIYNLTFASLFFGNDIKDITSTAIKSDRGVDAQDSITLTYRDGKMAILHCSFLSKEKNQGIIYGQKGRIEVEPFWHPQEIKVFLNDQTEPIVYRVPFDFTGYEYEVRAAVKAINRGASECPEMPHQETLRIMKIMDDLRADWGVRYPFELKPSEKKNAQIRLVNSISVEDYNRLRAAAGWREIPLHQAQAGLQNTAYQVAALDGETTVAMARILWDGGYTAYLADVIVHPDYQELGIGKKMVDNIMDFLYSKMEHGDSILLNLSAAKGKEAFYRKLGFKRRPNREYGAGMSLWLEK
ncbi:MAG: GNAT family N-acetyltransferase [Ruminococcaceae bacterium]|nr:GNAT family N-acetyltransferase [Oscillospiraceae bacterium]